MGRAPGGVQAEDVHGPETSAPLTLTNPTPWGSPGAKDSDFLCPLPMPYGLSTLARLTGAAAPAGAEKQGSQNETGAEPTQPLHRLVRRPHLHTPVWLSRVRLPRVPRITQGEEKEI